MSAKLVILPLVRACVCVCGHGWRESVWRSRKAPLGASRRICKSPPLHASPATRRRPTPTALVARPRTAEEAATQTSSAGNATNTSEAIARALHVTRSCRCRGHRSMAGSPCRSLGRRKPYDGRMLWGRRRPCHCHKGYVGQRPSGRRRRWGHRPPLNRKRPRLCSMVVGL